MSRFKILMLFLLLIPHNLALDYAAQQIANESLGHQLENLTDFSQIKDTCLEQNSTCITYVIMPAEWNDNNQEMQQLIKKYSENTMKFTGIILVLSFVMALGTSIQTISSSKTLADGFLARIIKNDRLIELLLILMIVLLIGAFYIFFTSF